VEQESFMSAGEIRDLARQAGIQAGVSVLDLCCGVAGPGRFITRELGCTYLGVDYSASAIEIAREHAGELPCHFEVSTVPPIPHGPFDVVLLLETLLAFPDKATLLSGISGALTAGGRFAFTMEEGMPLTEGERARMPDADTVWLTSLPAMLACLDRVGLVVRWRADCSRSHLAMADSLTESFAADAANISAQIGSRALDELLAAHRLWSEWLREGRIRKLALVAEKAPLASCDQPRADQQDVVVGVSGRHNLRRGRSERAGSVYLLASGILAGAAVGSGPEALGRAGGEPIHVAPEDDGLAQRTTRQERPELGALRRVRGRLIELG
jgi:SAM-dependent methyltransferase